MAAPAPAGAAGQVGRAGLPRTARAGARLLWRPGLRYGVVVFAVIVLLATLGPLVWHQPVQKVDVRAALEAPSTAHPMGTDQVGRDVLARFDRGAGISLLVGVIAVLASTLGGTALGLVAGTARPWADNVLMRIADCFLAFPPIILAMAVTVGLGTGLPAATIGVTCAIIPYTARLVRSDVLRLRSRAFVEAAQALGASRRRIVLRHLLPNLSATILAQASISFGYSVLAVAGLSFIGLGAQIPTPEWGAMLTEGFQYVLTGAWWIGVFPGLGLLLAVSAANSLADGIRVQLEPRNARSEAT